MQRLTGRKAVVTGAARGIGAAIVRRLVQEGAFVWCTDIRDAEGLALAGEMGPMACYRHLDVREERDWEELLEAIQASGGALDILVNNAGITGFEEDPAPQDPERVTLDQWRAVMATNAEGVMLGCRAAIRGMRPAGSGSIINLSSRSGLVGIPGAAAYAASKAAVRNHTKTVSLYCAQQGLAIRCNSVHPAAILTPMWEALLGQGPDRALKLEAFAADIPLRRFGTAEEVASLVAFLASDESAYCTGAEFNLDGGLLAGASAAPRG